MWELPLAAVDCPFVAVFLGGEKDWFEASGKPVSVANPSGRMITRRLRLGEGDRPSGRPKWLGWSGGAGSLADPAGRCVLVDDEGCISGLEGRRRRFARGVESEVEIEVAVAVAG